MTSEPSIPPPPEPTEITFAGILLPANSVYFAGGTPPQATLCVTGSDRKAPIRAAVQAADRPIGYLSQLGTVPFGAVSEAVSRIDLLIDGDTVTTFAVLPSKTAGGGNLLHDLGNGWHSFNDLTGWAGSGRTKATVIAYDRDGFAIDERSVTLPQP